jgi:hypothetical protein
VIIFVSSFESFLVLRFFFVFFGFRYINGCGEQAGGKRRIHDALDVARG